MIKQSKIAKILFKINTTVSFFGEIQMYILCESILEIIYNDLLNLLLSILYKKTGYLQLNFFLYLLCILLLLFNQL